MNRHDPGAALPSAHGGGSPETFDVASWMAAPAHAAAKPWAPLPPLAPAHQVCPRADDPLTFLHRIGASMMSNSLWPEDAWRNAIVFYLARRSLWLILIDLAAFLPWIGALAMEVGGVALALSVVNNQMLLGIYGIQLLFLPLLAGLWAQACLLAHHRAIRGRLPVEEVAVTCLRVDEQVMGFCHRPVSIQLAAMLVGTVASAVLLVISQAIFFARSSLYNDWVFIACVLAIFYRGFYMLRGVEFACVLALRSALFIPDPLKAQFRAARDWMIPWAFIPIIYTFLVFASFAIQAYTDVVFWLIFVTPPLALWVLFLIPHLMHQYAEESLYWAMKSHGRWSHQTGEEFPGVPGGLLGRWRLQRSMRDLSAKKP